MPRPPARRTLLERAIEQGHAFSTGALFDGLRQGETIYLYLENPVIEDVRYSVAGDLAIRSSGSVSLTAFRDQDIVINDKGTELQTTSLRTDSEATPNARGYANGDFDLPQETGEAFSPIVTTHIGGEASLPTPLVAPDDALLAQLKVESVGGADVAFEFTWTPLTDDEIPEVLDIDDRTSLDG